MITMERIRYIPHNSIDKGKWDACIENSQQPLIYALSWYLDIVSPGWDALVNGDYREVMPLTWKRKWGIKYIILPIWVQKLGVFSQEPVDKISLDNWLKKVPRKFRKVDIRIEEHCFSKKYCYKTCSNQTLNLNKDYNEIKKNYSSSNLKNIRSAIKFGMLIKPESSIKQLLYYYKEFHLSKGIYVEESEYNKLYRILELALNKNNLTSWLVLFGDKVIAVVCFIEQYGRIYVHSIVSQAGRRFNTMFYCKDKFFESKAGKPLVFDFAGSDITGVAYQNKGFGAITNEYQHIRLSRFPFNILHLFK